MEQNRMILTLVVPAVRRLIEEADESDGEDCAKANVYRSRTRLLWATVQDVLRRGREIERVWTRPKPADNWYTSVYPNLSDLEFKEHFRVSKTTFKFLIEELKPSLQRRNTQLREAVPLEKRVAVGLHYLASCHEYSVLSSLFGIGKSTGHNIVKAFVEGINALLLPKFINFPSTVEELKSVVKDFVHLLHFPQCGGALDCCHIPISPPKYNAKNYSNARKWSSIVLFAVVDARHKFLYVSVGSPGSNTNSYILQNSTLNTILESDLLDLATEEVGGTQVPVCLIGDSAFPLSRHLLNPFPEHKMLSDVKKGFNYALAGVRQMVEHTFGRVRSRFRVVDKKMDGAIRNAIQIIKACCVLHNVCEHLNDMCQSSWRNDDGKCESIMPNMSKVNENGTGTEVRDAIAKHLFEMQTTKS